MTVRFKVDEDLPAEIASLLRARGHDATSVLEEGLGGVSDSRVWDVAEKERRCLMTADKGFVNTSRFPFGAHGGIVLLRLPRESRAGYVQLVEGLLSRFDMKTARGAVVSVSPDAIRIHRRAR